MQKNEGVNKIVNKQIKIEIYFKHFQFNVGRKQKLFKSGSHLSRKNDISDTETAVSDWLKHCFHAEVQSSTKK